MTVKSLFDPILTKDHRAAHFTSGFCEFAAMGQHGACPNTRSLHLRP